VALSDLLTRRRGASARAEVGDADRSIRSTKALARFIAALGARVHPVVLDLGPVVGQNVSFFGEQLGCKIVVEDLAQDIDRHVRQGTLEELPQFMAARLRLATSSVDGILCWDVFDYLDKAAAESLARQLTRLLRANGVLLAFFGTAEPRPGTRPEYTRHVVVDEATLQRRPYAGARQRQRPLPNRDIERLFQPLQVVEQFLLKSNLREVLLRNPQPPADEVAASPVS
jgi:hypothetical protein